MSVEIGTAYVTILPAAVGLQKNIERELAPMSGIAAKEGTKAGTALGGNVSKGLRASLSKLSGAAAGFGVPFAHELSAVNAQLDLSAAKTGNFSASLSKLGGIQLLAAGAGLAILGKSSVSAAQEFETAQARLGVAVQNIGGSIEAARPGIEKTDEAMRKLGFTDTETESSLARLVGATHDVTKAQNLQTTAADLARFKHESLADATGTLVLLEAGRFRGLGALGVKTSDLAGRTDATTIAMQRLNAVVGGQGVAFMDTFDGKLAAVRAQADHLEVTLGSALIPKIESLASGTVGAIQGFENANRATDGFLGKVALAGAALPVAAFATAKLGLAGAALGGGLAKAGAAAAEMIVPTSALAIANEAVAASAEHAAVAEIGFAAAFGAAATAIIPVGLAYLAVKAADDALKPSLQSSTAAVEKLSKAFAVLGTNGNSQFLIQQYGAGFRDLTSDIETASRADSGFFASKGGGVGKFAVDAFKGLFNIKDGSDQAQQAVNDTSKSLKNLYQTDPQAASAAFENLKSHLIANGTSAGQVDKVYRDLEKTLHLLPGPTDAATQAQTNLATAQQKYASDLIRLRGVKTPDAAATLAGDYDKVRVASGIVADAQGKVEAATNAGNGALDGTKKTAEAARFAYLGLAKSVGTYAQALDAITTKAFGPTRATIAADTARTGVQSALDALNNPDAGSSSSGGSGQTATAAALEQAQKVLSLRDAKLGETHATQAVNDAEQALTQSRKDATTATKAVTVAQENLRTTLHGVARDSQAAKDAINALTTAQNAAEGSKLSVNDAQRSVTQAKLDSQSKRLSVTDAQTTLSNDIADQADPEQIAKDTIALKAARLDAAGSADAVREAELNLSNAQLDAKQKTKDLTEAQRVENGTLHGYKPASDEAKTARQQLTDAQTQARTATDAVRQAQDQLTTATNSTADASLALLHAQADLDGKLTASSGAASAGKKLDSLVTRVDNARTAILDLADAAAKADLATGHSFGHSVLGEIQSLESYAAANPLLAHAFDDALKQLETSFAADLIKRNTVPGGGFHVPGSGIVRRASGGDLAAGQPSFVGESGVELWIPDVPGSIVPNHSLKNSRPMAGAYGGGSTVQVYALDPRTASQLVIKALEDHNGGYLPRTIKTTS